MPITTNDGADGKSVGTGANDLVQLDGTGKLPAVDGSLLTGIVGAGGATVLNELSDVNVVGAYILAFDPTVGKTSANFILSNDNRTAQRSSNEWETGTAYPQISSGKWYWETVVDSGPHVKTGITDITAIVTSDHLGNTAGEWNYYASSGTFDNNNVVVGTGPTATNGDVIGIALDMDAGKMWFSKNNVWMLSGDPAAGTGENLTSIPTAETFVPAIALYGATATYRLSQSEQTYTAPTGFDYLDNLSIPGAGVLDKEVVLYDTTTSKWINDYISISEVTGTGTAAALNVGTAANNIVQLDGSGLLPAVDGSALTNLTLPAGVGSSPGFKGARVYGTTTQTLTTAVSTAISFGAEQYDTNGFHDNVTNNTRLTASEDGYYIITGQCYYASNATGDRMMTIKRNGDGAQELAIAREPANDTSHHSQSIVTVAHLAAGDYVEITARQTSGGNVDLLVSPNEYSNATISKIETAAAGGGFSGAYLESAGTQSIPNASTTDLTLATVNFDTDSYVSGNTVVIPADGYYSINGYCLWDSPSATGARILYLYVDAAAVRQDIHEPEQVGWSLHAHVSYQDYFTAGQVIKIAGRQNTGGNYNIISCELNIHSIDRGSAAGALNDLTDVDLTTTAPVTDDVLKYDGTDWVPGTGASETTTAKAWVNFNGIGGTTINGQHNVASVTYNGTGDYTINFTNALADANYAVAFGWATSYNVGTQIDAANSASAPTLKSTTQLRIRHRVLSAGTAVDVYDQSVIIFGV